VFVNNIKCKRVDILPLYQGFAQVIKRYVNRYKKKIEENEGYLVFRRGRDPGNVSANTMRRHFRDYLEKAGLKEPIATIPCKGNQCYGRVKERNLYRLTTHSLRHTYITEIYKSTSDPIATQKLARHKDFRATQDYINFVDDDLRDALNKTYGDIEMDKDVEFQGFDDPEFMEFMKFYRMWKKMKS